mgnify:CR=1 FL=1
MTPTDYGKLAYQSEFGPGHMISDKQAALSRLLEEWQVIAAAPGSAGTGLCPERRQIAGGDAPSHAAAPTAEPIGDGLCRFHLNGDYNPAQAAPLLTELFSRTALEHTGTKEGLAGKLSLLGGLPTDGDEHHAIDNTFLAVPMNKGIIGAILVAAVFLFLLWRLAKKHRSTEVICLVALTLYLFMENKPFLVSANPFLLMLPVVFFGSPDSKNQTE